METVLPVDDFQSLGGDQQSEEIFRLLSLLSPFAGEVTGLKTSIDTALTRIRWGLRKHLYLKTTMKTDRTSYNIVLCRKVNNKCISSVIKRSNISTFSELDGDGKFNLHQNQSQPEAGIHCRTRDNCSITAGLDNDIDQGEMTCDKDSKIQFYCAHFPQISLCLDSATRSLGGRWSLPTRARPSSPRSPLRTRSSSPSRGS